MSSLEKVCRDVVESTPDISGCWLIDLKKQEIAALYAPNTAQQLNEALVQASLGWLVHQHGMAHAEKVPEASISAQEQSFYFQASHPPDWGFVLSTRARVSPGIGWAITRNFATHAFTQLRRSQITEA